MTAVRVTSGQRADEYELPNLVEGHSELLARMPRRVAADRKYATRANYEYLLEAHLHPRRPPHLQWLHAYTRRYGRGQASSRPKDLIDMVLISEFADFRAGRLRQVVEGYGRSEPALE